jgi:hypothetical protein
MLIPRQLSSEDSNDLANEWFRASEGRTEMQGRAFLVVQEASRRPASFAHGCSLIKIDSSAINCFGRSRGVIWLTRLSEAFEAHLAISVPPQQRIFNG